MSAMREAFENYYGGDKRPSVRDGEYIDFTTQAAWEAWQACMEHTCSPLRFTVGKYLLSRLPDGRLWMEIEGDGEGGVFDESDLYLLVDKFYKENF